MAVESGGLARRGQGYTLPALWRTAFGGRLQRKAAPQGLQIPDSGGGWCPIVSRIREAFSGAWQQNIETPLSSVLQHPTVFACLTLIAGDMAKMRWDLTTHIGNDVWLPVDNNPAFSPVLRRPNHFQTDFQFREHWTLSKLIYGNTYVLKQRDLRGVVTAMHVLDPCRVKPLVAPDGSVFYELKADTLAQWPQENIVPAREIIHDHFNELFHPLVGISPLYAAGIPAMLGLKIETASTSFFGNGSMPGGIVFVPGVLDQTKADDLKARWEANFGGANQGRVAILPDAMRFEPVPPGKANESQLSEQWLNAAAAIATAFHVPFYMVGGPPPPYNNPQAQSVEYLTRCLQPLIVSMEMVLDDGLGLTPDRINGVQYGVQLKTSDLLLMDTLTLMQVLSQGVSSALIKPNDGRAQLNLPPVEGGDTPYLQQQNFSLAALNRRDQEPAPSPNASTTAPQPDEDGADDDVPDEDMTAAFDISLRKALALEQAA